MPGFLDELLSLPILDNSQREAAASRFTPGMSRDRIVSELLELEWITAYQAQALRSGRGRDLVVGSYIIRRPIGAGGMGHVFEAWQPLFGKAVALKVIHRDRLNEPTAIARFEREIRAIARVSHPNIVAVHHADRHEEAFYLTMELVAGTTLDQLLASQGPFPIPDACDAVRQAAEGLQHIHEQGLVHRDIKPSNLIRAASGATKILDLGLALLPSAATLTTRGQSLIGTVDYIAPEQVTAPHTTDIRADIYSLGCTLYHILTGRVLFPEAHPCARPYLHQVEMPIPATSLRPEIPARLGEVLGRMLAKRRDDRYSTPNEVAAVLAPFALRPAPIRLGECIGGWWIEEGLPGAGRAGYFRAVRKDEQALVQIIPDRALRPDEAERFVATWSALSGIRASALPVVKEVGRDRACRFVALDPPQGVWLDELLAETGGLTPERACELVLHVSEGLAEAHKHGVIHGNLRPSVVVYRPGGAVLVGFGLPLAARVAPVATGARLSGRHLAFAAPEQVRKGRAETSSDVYGLAGLLFHAINAALGEKSEPDYYDSALVPAGLRDLLGRCLSADPSRRPATAAEFAAQLRAACGPPKVRIGIPGRWMSRPAAGGAEWVAVESAAGFVMEHGRAYSFKAHRELDDVALTGFGRLDPDAPLVRIDLRGTRVTDAGLAHIAHLTAV